jgi:hypothetical protein
MAEVSQAPRKPSAPQLGRGHSQRGGSTGGQDPMAGPSGAPRARARLALLLGPAALLVAAAIILAAHLVPGGAGTVTLRTAALTRSQAAYAALQRAVERLTVADRACHSFTCQTAIDAQTARAYRAFAATITAIPMPAGAPSIAARQLEEAATQTALVAGTLAAAGSATQLRSLEAISPSMVDLVQVQQDNGYLHYLLTHQ